MTSKILIGGTALVMALTATVALADARGQGPRMDFATMDANSDGSITIEDIEALRAQRFAALDADGNGSVSRQEFMDHAAGRAGDRADDCVQPRAIPSPGQDGNAGRRTCLSGCHGRVL